MSDKYFATLPINEIGQALKDKIDQFYNFMNGSGIFRRQWSAALHYYGISPNSNAQTDTIRSGGRNGQLAMLKMNHLRNLAQHLIQLTTSQKPAPIPIATNSDAKSQQQASLAKGILDYYSREKRVDRVLRQAVEYAVAFGGEAFTQTTWDPVSQYAEANGDGDVKCIALMPSEVIRDPMKNGWENLDWVIVREWKSRFEVADRYNPEDPEATETDQIREAILNQPTRTSYNRNRMSLLNWMFMSNLFGKSDDIAIYHFWHKKSASVPDGRYVVVLEDGTVLYDGALPYKQIPVRRISPGDLADSPFGYTPIFDLLVIQEAIDALYSAIATNQMTFGVQLIMAMKGSDIDFKQLSRGLSFIEYANPEGKPESLNLTHTPAEVFKFIEQLERVMETLSGVNAVARGNAPSDTMSGSGMALLQSQAISFSSGLQQSYAHLVEDVYTDIINIIKEYANNPKTITIVGKYNRSMMASFTGDSIDQINRVVVQAGSAMEQTLPGRMQIAQDLIQAQLIKKPEEYIALIKTGSLDPMLEGEHAELILIKSENERMAEGQLTSAVPTDEHALHIKEHRCVLATPEARDNPQLIRTVTDHIVEHIKYLSDPGLINMLLVLGQQPLAMATMPDVGQGYAPQLPESIKKTEGPNMPNNPLTGQDWDPETGGGVVTQETTDANPPDGNE